MRPERTSPKIQGPEVDALGGQGDPSLHTEQGAGPGFRVGAQVALSCDSSCHCVLVSLVSGLFLASGSPGRGCGAGLPPEYFGK